RLVAHDVGIDRAVTQVPLVVRGLPGVAPAHITVPVQLVDIMPTIARWAGVPAPKGLAGEVLPTADPTSARARLIVAEFHYYHDRFLKVSDDTIRERLLQPWVHCTASDRVSGDMRSIIRFPYELIWYERYSSQLFDLLADPAETRDLAATMPERRAQLEDDLH